MDGHLVWKGVAETLDLARLRIKILMVLNRQNTSSTASRQVTGSLLRRMAQSRAEPDTALKLAMVEAQKPKYRIAMCSTPTMIRT